MNHRHIRLFFCVASVFMFVTSPMAQSLSFSDILKIYSLDSSATQKYCRDKNWQPAERRNDGAATRYEFLPTDTSHYKASLDLSYPNDSTSLNVQLNYHFATRQEYDKLKEAIRKAGFKHQSSKQVKGALPSYAERYVSKNSQIELIRPEGKQLYWLFLHPVGDYTW